MRRSIEVDDRALTPAQRRRRDRLIDAFLLLCLALFAFAVYLTVR